jgi:hypothetical protein
MLSLTRVNLSDQLYADGNLVYGVGLEVHVVELERLLVQAVQLRGADVVHDALAKIL